MIPFIASLGLDHFSYMAILALMLSKKFQKTLEGLSETRAAFQGLEDSLSEEKNSEMEVAGDTGLKTQRDALKIY